MCSRIQLTGYSLQGLPGEAAEAERSRYCLFFYFSSSLGELKRTTLTLTANGSVITEKKGSKFPANEIATQELVQELDLMHGCLKGTSCSTIIFEFIVFSYFLTFFLTFLQATPMTQRKHFRTSVGESGCVYKFQQWRISADSLKNQSLDRFEDIYTTWQVWRK